MPTYPHKTKNLTYTYQTRQFACEVVMDGKKKRVKMLHPMWYQHEINKFKVGEKITMNLTNKKPLRTEQQNRYLWGVYYPIIAEERGHTIKEIHQWAKGKHLPSRVIEVLGDKVRLTSSTTDLTVGEFIEYIMNIEADTGIMAPPTQDFNWK